MQCNQSKSKVNQSTPKLIHKKILEFNSANSTCKMQLQSVKAWGGNLLGEKQYKIWKNEFG